MIITKKRSDTIMTYEYLYEQVGEDPLKLTFFASDEGPENPSQGRLIGKCYQGFYFKIYSEY
jgi:hypothetical protein